MGKKGRCVKSPAGRKSAPKKAASPKQVAALAKGRANRAAKRAAAPVASPAPAAHPMAAMACNNLPEDDCVRHPGCNFVPAHVTKKGTNVKAFCKTSTKHTKRGPRKSPRA
jgi:hypothetical protein